MERSGLKKCDTIRTIRRNLKLKGPEPSMLTLVDFYLWNTNTHGCRRIAASRGPIKRTLWILLTMTAAAMIFWECVQLHLSYHTATMSVTMRHGKTEFPTVTICNLNPYKFNLSKHFLKDLDKMARCIVSRISSGRSAIFGENHVKACNMEFPVDPTPLVYMNMTLPANVKVMEILTGNDYLVNGSLLDLRSHSNQKIGMSDWWIALRLCDANVSNCIYNTFSSAISAMQEWYRLHFFNIMATVPEKDKIAMGYSADELIYACLYSGRTCDARDFTQFHHPHFGNCFVFNNDSSSKNLTALIPGNTHGLQLILHTEQQDYIPFLAGTAGTRIAIHSKYTKSFIEDVGINLQPATETLLGLSVSEIQKLGVPYSDCTEDGSDVPIENLYYSSYSLQICLQSCFQKEILQQCGCGHYERPLPAGYKYCNSQEFPGWEYCYYKLYSNYIAEELNCYRMCKQTCFQKEYTTKVSLAEWPSENTKDWLLKVLSIEQGLSRNLVLETSDVTRVNIYFNKLVVRSFVESPANTIVTLLSNCGGQLGLWMSCSVICIIEIIEIFAIDLPWILLKKMRRGWSRNATMTVTSPPQTVAPALEEAQFEPPTFQSALQCPSFPTTPSTPPPNYYSLSVRRELEFANDD